MAPPYMMGMLKHKLHDGYDVMGVLTLAKLGVLSIPGFGQSK